MKKWWLEDYPEPLSIQLYRDSFRTPWGFRIAGGLDFGQTPIVVTQVNVCSPADGQLCVGDLIISVDHQQVFRRRHFDVLSLIAREAGGTLDLQIYRGATADEIKTRSGFNIRFHAPLSYYPVNISTSWHPPSSETLERPNAMYRTVYSGRGRPTTIPLRRQNQPCGRSAKQIFFNPQQDDYMLQKVQNSLDALTMGRSSRLDDLTDRQDPDYNYAPVSDKKRLFNQPDATSPGSYLQQYHRQPYRWRNSTDSRPNRAHSVGAGQRPTRVTATPSSYSAFVRPRSSMGHSAPGHSKAPDFCWTPRGFRPRRGMSQPTRGGGYHYQPSQYSSYQNSDQPEPIAPQTVHVYRNEGDEHYVPPWRGTLVPASPSAWIEGQLIDPTNPIYHRERHPKGQAPVEPVQVIETKEADDGRKIVHLQYNSPLQLYSQDAAKAALEDQTAKQDGPEGTLMIKGGRPGAPPQKITESSVYKMVHEEDLRRQRRMQRAANTPQPHNRAMTPTSRQRHASSTAASANGELKVVLAQPSQNSQINYFQGDHHTAGAGSSDF